MAEKTYRVYPYRWVILAMFMLVNLAIQILWICFAPITGPAAKYYGVSDLQIGFLAMSFMVVYIPALHPHLLADRHAGLPQIGGHRGGDDGRLRPAARVLRRRLQLGAGQHARPGSRPAVHAQLGQHGGGQMVPDRGTGDRLGPGDRGQLHRGGRRPGHLAAAGAEPTASPP